VVSFKQRASATAAPDTVLVEVSTDTGLTGWSGAWGYVWPRGTATATGEMIARRRLTDVTVVPAPR
jgi:hypothetical protein